MSNDRRRTYLTSSGNKMNRYIVLFGATKFSVFDVFLGRDVFNDEVYSGGFSNLSNMYYDNYKNTFSFGLNFSPKSNSLMTKGSNISSYTLTNTNSDFIKNMLIRINEDSYEVLYGKGLRCIRVDSVTGHFYNIYMYNNTYYASLIDESGVILGDSININGSMNLIADGYSYNIYKNSGAGRVHVTKTDLSSGEEIYSLDTSASLTNISNRDILDIAAGDHLF